MITSKLGSAGFRLVLARICDSFLFPYDTFSSTLRAIQAGD